VGIAATSLYLVLFRVMQVAAPLARMTVAAATGAVLNAAVSVALGAWLGLFGVALGTSLVALAVILVQIRSVRPFLGPAWTASALRATALPVLVCISASLALIGVAHAADLGNVVRAVSGLGLAATSAVWLRLGSRDG